MKKTKEHRFDYTLFAVVLILLTIGVVMIYSASAFMAQVKWNQSELFFKKQLFWFVLAIVTILIVSKINYSHWRYMAWPFMLISLVLLAVVLTQREVNEAHRWIHAFGYSLQPSEVFKYALLLFTALYIAKDGNMVNSVKKIAWPWGAVVAVGIGLILLEPDLSMALLMVASLAVIFFMAGLKWRYVLASTVVPVLIVAVMVFGFGYKSGRITAFLDNQSVVSTNGYQEYQSLLAIGSGELFGKGIGRGSAKLFHLPESHTDFIISNVAEEGGFLLVTICLSLYLIIIIRGLRIASLAKDRFAFFLAFGIVTMLSINIIINVGVATGMLPTTGMTLPFLSYGGSSILCSSFGIGVLLNISRHQNRVSKLFEKRK